MKYIVYKSHGPCEILRTEIRNNKEVLVIKSSDTEFELVEKESA